MYCVHWILTRPRHTAEQAAAWKDMTNEDLDLSLQETVPNHRLFGSDEMSAALKFCEELRARRRAGERLSFIGMASEDANMVGEQGVKAFDGFQADGVTPYDWKKRRI